MIECEVSIALKEEDVAAEACLREKGFGRRYQTIRSRDAFVSIPASPFVLNCGMDGGRIIEKLEPKAPRGLIFAFRVSTGDLGAAPISLQ